MFPTFKVNKEKQTAKHKVDFTCHNATKDGAITFISICLPDINILCPQI